MKATTTTALTDARPTVDDQQQLYERLVDSLEAMEEVKSLTEDLGEFVVASRIRATRSRPASSEERPRKRKRTSPTAEDVDAGDEEEEDDSVDSAREESTKRMMMLYQHLRRTQILFQAEIAKFIQETEKECKTEAAPVSAE